MVDHELASAFGYRARNEKSTNVWVGLPSGARQRSTQRVGVVGTKIIGREFELRELTSGEQVKDGQVNDAKS